MENYFASQRDHIFRNVAVLIYVFDVESRDRDRDMHYYQSCLEAILQHSSDARVFCLVHKMDLVQEGLRDSVREAILLCFGSPHTWPSNTPPFSSPPPPCSFTDVQVFAERAEELQRRSLPLNTTIFKTSIWDETLYRAWSAIVYALVPDVAALEARAAALADLCEADELVLFERATFLVISHAERKQTGTAAGLPGPGGSAGTSAGGGIVRHAGDGVPGSIGGADPHRFEKISNIIKQFKLSCRYGSPSWRSSLVANTRHLSRHPACFSPPPLRLSLTLADARAHAPWRAVNPKHNSRAWRSAPHALQPSSTYSRRTRMPW